MEKILLAPEFKVTCGEYELSDGISVECCSSSAAQADWAKVGLTEELQGLIQYQDMDLATVELGYGDDFGLLLSGYARRASGDYWKEILVKDDMIRLDRTVVQGTFLDCCPEDVLRYVLGCAGISRYELAGAVEKKPVFVLPVCTVRKAIEEVNTFWGLDYPFFFRDHILYWGILPKQSEIYVLEEDETIMSLEMRGGLWEAETIGIPWIRHSELIEVEHSKFSGTATVTQTLVRSDDRGRTRMYIYFKGAGNG